MEQNALVASFCHQNLKCTEVELFKSVYQRNNKNTGQKNLRCFPHCCEGHRPNSFCGSSVQVEVQHECIEEIKSQLVSYCAFEIINDDDTCSSGSWKCGDIIDENCILKDVKSNSNPLGKWMKGTLDDEVYEKNGVPVVRYEFNKGRQSFHYGWTSSRGECHRFHCLKIYFFFRNENVDSDNARIELQCCGTLASIHFQISSRRRHSNRKGKQLAQNVERQPMPQNVDRNKKVYQSQQLIPNELCVAAFKAQRLVILFECAMKTKINMHTIMNDISTTEEDVQMLLRTKALLKLTQHASTIDFFKKMEQYFRTHGSNGCYLHSMDKAFVAFVELFFDEASSILYSIDSNLSVIGLSHTILKLSDETAYADSRLTMDELKAMKSVESIRSSIKYYQQFLSQMGMAYKASLIKGEIGPMIPPFLQQGIQEDDQNYFFTGVWLRDPAMPNGNFKKFADTYNELAGITIIGILEIFTRKIHAKQTSQAFYVRSDASVLPKLWPGFVTDGCPHTLDLLPVGVSTEICFNEYHAADYKAWCSENDSPTLEMYAWPSATSNGPRFRATRQFIRDFHDPNRMHIRLLIERDAEEHPEKLPHYQSLSLSDRFSTPASWRVLKSASAYYTRISS